MRYLVSEVCAKGGGENMQKVRTGYLYFALPIYQPIPTYSIPMMVLYFFGSGIGLLTVSDLPRSEIRQETFSGYRVLCEPSKVRQAVAPTDAYQVFHQNTRKAHPY
jgi:hypothetical protein